MPGSTPRLDNPALFALLSSLADNKQTIGRQYAAWCNGAPALEAAVAAAAMAQDELGHARTLYPLLESFVQAEDDLEYIEPMTRMLHYRLSALDTEFRGWPDFVATTFLIDTALTIFFEAAQHASYEPLRQRALKIVQEEHGHFVYGKGWVLRLARAGGAVRSALHSALQRLWDETLCWFGPRDDPFMQRLYDEGVIDASPDELRNRYLHRIMPVLNEAGLPFPVSFDADTWQPVHTLPWSNWDAEKRRWRNTQ